MRTDNNGEALSDKQVAESSSELEENTVNWLLDMDMSDPEEKLFALDQQEEVDTTLTEEELAVARRPMTRGSAGADDLESYIGEEIVISSDGQSSDIYNTSDVERSRTDSESSAEDPMAVDYSTGNRPAANETSKAVSEGSDILGLSENDDIGEKFLVIKRVRSSERSDAECVASEEEANTESVSDKLESQGAETLAEDATAALTDAPVLRLINTDAPLTGANDETDDLLATRVSELEASGDDLESAAVGEYSVEDITSQDVQDPETDSVLELELVPLEGDDTQADDDIPFNLDETADHHAAFIGQRGEAVTASDEVSGLFPQIEKELAIVINERLASLGLAAGAVRSELMLESDETPVSVILAAGFEPILAVCPAPLATLQNLPPIDVNRIHLKFSRVDNASSCNRLFADDFEFHNAKVSDTESDEVQEIQTELDSLEFEPSSGFLSEQTVSSEDIDALDALLDEGSAEAIDFSLDDGLSIEEPNSFEGFLGEAEVLVADSRSSGTDEAKTSDSTETFDGFLSDFSAGNLPEQGQSGTNTSGEIDGLTVEIDSSVEDSVSGAALSVEHSSIAEGVNHGVDSADALTAPVSPVTSDTEARESASLRDGNEPEGALEAAPTADSTSDSILRLENDAHQPASPVAATSADVEDVLPEEATTDTISQALEGRHSDVVSVGDNTGDDSGSVESSSLKEDVAANTDSPLGAVDDTETTAIVGLVAEVPSLPDAEDKEDIFEGFGDDMFAEDLLETASAHEQSDIDALFDDLSLGAEEPDAICGLGMEEFPVDSESDCLEADSVVGEAENAAQEFEPTPEHDQPPTVSSDDASQATDPEPDSALQAVAQQSSGSGVVDGEFNCIPDGIIFSDASPGGGDIFADFLEAFVEEGSSEIEKLEDAVAAWERDVASEDAFAVVGRVLHTIKGIAKGVGLHYYGTLVHNFETLLGAMARPEAGLESDYFRIVNAWLDACVRGLDHIQDARSDIPYVLPQTRTQAQTAATTSLEAGDAPEAIQIQTQSQDSESQREAKRERVDDKARKQSKKIADDGAKVLAAQQSIRITSEKLDDMLNLSNEAQQLGVRTAQSVNRGKRASMEMQHRLGSLRSHISAIADRALRSVAARGVKQDASMDALEMDQYSELQEAANILREGVEDLADLVDFANRQNAQIEALLKHQANVISSIGSSIRAARVVPVSRLMPGLRRLVRTVSVDLNKTVNFQVLNEIGTLDRDDYARCQTILDHMVRNALDHGIETATQRKEAGKPEEGLITIDIRKAGADSIITLSDDGRGIDPQKMRESAVAKGLEIDVESLTDDEAAQLIFHKGFSTAGSVSQISGRGVGMDIVLTELQEMGGDIQINSEPGKGTSFDIRVPSSITVNGALLVSAGEQSYAIPLGGLIGVEQVPVEEFFAAVQGNTLLSVAGLDCEPAYLATLCRTGHSLDAKTWRTSVPVVVAGSDERRMAIAVDDVEEALELVIRSLGAQFADVPGVAGAATTAAGEAIVALDLNLLVDSVGEDDRSPLHVGAEREEALTVMVVDDSRTQRMVATSQLETVGVATVTAENGSVAIDLLNSADRLPDIILMDVEMPVKDGIQALREIRKSVRYGHVPVIMVTSRTGLKHRAMAQAAGCNGYMGKPFNFRMLIGQINELTGHRLQLS